MRGEIFVIVHATEDYNKVINCMFRVLKISHSHSRIIRQDLSGHYGNPITYARIMLDHEDTRNLLENIFKNLSESDLNEFLASIEEYFDRSTLYIRLDKQYLCAGVIRLFVKDPLKIVVRGVSRKYIEDLIKRVRS